MQGAIGSTLFALPGLPALGACIRIALATMKLPEGTAREPGITQTLQTKDFPGVGVIDGAFVVATGIGLWFAAASPFGQ